MTALLFMVGVFAVAVGDVCLGVAWCSPVGYPGRNKLLARGVFGLAAGVLALLGALAR